MVWKYADLYARFSSGLSVCLCLCVCSLIPSWSMDPQVRCALEYMDDLVITSGEFK